MAYAVFSAVKVASSLLAYAVSARRKFCRAETMEGYSTAMPASGTITPPI